MPQLYYEVHGDEGPHLLLVHGLLSSRSQWILNIDALADFCRPVVIELFGHGRSPSPPDPERFSPPNYIREFEGIREALGVERWFVCGQSLGASLTLAYALAHPERITAQVFTNSRSALTDESYEGMSEVLMDRLRKDGRRFISGFPVHPSKSKYMPAEMKATMTEDADLVDTAGFGYTLTVTVPRCSVRKRLADMKVPTLLITGLYDRRFADLRKVAEERIPRLTVKELRGGHAVNIDAADEFNAAVRDYILHIQAD